MQQVPKDPQDTDDVMDSDYRAAGQLQHLTPEFRSTHQPHFLGCPFMCPLSLILFLFPSSACIAAGARGIIWKHH